MNDGRTPNRGDGYLGQYGEYLKRAQEACASGDRALGMHLYLTAYEKAAADPDIADGTALEGLREAWHLACELKERSIAEYVFEKLEPYLTGEEIAACAHRLQSLALDRLEEYGFSREELQDMAEMISQDYGLDASVVKVESISVPHVELLGASTFHDGVSVVEATARPGDSSAGASDDASPAPFGMPGPQAPNASSGPRASAGTSDGEDRARVQSPEPKGGRRDVAPGEIGFGLADANDFNPYDLYRDYSIGKSYHAATNEGSGAAVFTRDAEREQAHEQFVADRKRAQSPQLEEAAEGEGKPEAPQGEAAPDAGGAAESASLPPASAGVPAGAPVGEGSAAPESAPLVPARGDAPAPGVAELPSMPALGEAPAGPLNYRTLAGYEGVVSVMRDFGVGLQNDPEYKRVVSMLNERHGLDRAPSLDTLLFRAPVIEDAMRFVDATVGEIGLPMLRMSMEEAASGMPVLCITTQGDRRPRMNHAHNRFEGPAILVIDELDTWAMPQPPQEAVEGIAGFVMANISRGAREAVNFIRSAVEDPDVYVLATATVDGEPDPFFYELLEPLTVVDIDLPDERERADIWAAIARDHPSMRSVSRDELVRYSKGLARYDIYLAARDALEDAYKQGLFQRRYVPVTPENVFEKIAACQPLESDEYRDLVNEVVKRFRDGLDDLDQLDELL